MRLDLIEDLKTAYVLTSTLLSWPDNHKDKKIQDNLAILASGNAQNTIFDNEKDQSLYETVASFDEVKNRINDKLSNFLGVKEVQIYGQDLDIESAKRLSDDWIKTLSQSSVQTQQLRQTSLNKGFEEIYRTFNNTDKYEDIKTAHKPYVDKRTGKKHYDGKQTWAASNFLGYHSYELKDLQDKERGDTTLPSQNKPFALKDETGSYISDENNPSLSFDDKERLLDSIAKNFDIFEQSLTRDGDGILKKDKTIIAKNYETAMIDGYLAQTLSDSLKNSFQEAQKQKIINIDELSGRKRNGRDEENQKSIYERLNGINEYVTKVFDKIKDFMQSIANKLSVSRNNENKANNVEFSM